jgi:hypothetical protein
VIHSSADAQSPTMSGAWGAATGPETRLLCPLPHQTPTRSVPDGWDMLAVSSLTFTETVAGCGLQYARAATVMRWDARCRNGGMEGAETGGRRVEAAGVELCFCEKNDDLTDAFGRLVLANCACEDGWSSLTS